MPVVKVLNGESAATSLIYPIKPKGASWPARTGPIGAVRLAAGYPMDAAAGPSTTAPRVLHSAGHLCRVETATADFRRVRVRHGTQGAMRTVPARYTLPEEGETATHVRHIRPNGRVVWRAAGSGEEGTHVRREGLTYEHVGRGGEGATHKQVRRRWVEAEPHEATHRAMEGGRVKQAETRHVIYSFGPDEVNPDDPEQVARAFEFVVQMHRDLHPGVQASFVGQADGEGGKFHVHGVWNATIAADMEVDGQAYRAGQKVGGALTDIEALRGRSDDYLAEHGTQYGLGPQRLERYSREAAETLDVTDRRGRATGQPSDKDRIRAAIAEAMEDARAVDLDGLRQALTERGVELHHRVTKTGKNRGKQTVSFKLPEMARYVGARRLGAMYAWDDTVDTATGEIVEGIESQLEANRSGRRRAPRPAPVTTRPPRPVATLDDAGIAEARALVVRLAEQERQRQRAAEWIKNLAALDAEPVTLDLDDPDAVAAWLAESDAMVAEGDALRAQWGHEPQDAPLAPLRADPVGTRSAPAAEEVRPSFEELLTQHQERIDAQRAALAAARGETVPESAVEAVEEPASPPTPALAPLPPEPADVTRSAPAAAEDEAYVSPVRDVDVRSRDEAFRDRVAVLDEHVVAARGVGARRYDPGLLDSMTVAKVKRYREHLASETLEVLGWRDEMSRRATRARMAGETYEAQRLREQVRQGHIYDPGPAAPARHVQDEPAQQRQDDGPELGG
ncbi:relaxase/mobilization nuclease domain-containing protein [Micrococcus antarcticus]|uniref:hypothetical protein n=1 Tax=Micrococcus antarcticus TaxID=86171 RepID=UPI00384C6F29